MKKYLIDSILAMYPATEKIDLLKKLEEKLELSSRQFQRYRHALIEDSIELKSYQLELIAELLSVSIDDLQTPSHAEF